jgi:hypothetical protein
MCQRMSQKCVVYGVSRILSTVCRGFFEDSKSDHGIAEEKQECLFGQRTARKHFEGLRSG